MLRKVTSYEEYRALFLEFQKKGKLLKNYQIIDINKIKKELPSGKIFVYISENSFFVLTLKHSYFNVFLYTNSYNSLKKDFINCHSDLTSLNDPIISRWHKTYSLSLSYKCDTLDPLFFEQLKEFGFKINKKLARYTIEHSIRSYIDFVPHEYRNVCFAKESDAKTIMSLMTENFDLIGNCVPEYSELVENIKKNQVVCVRDPNNQNKVIAFHYFEVINNIYFGLFDCTDIAYRKYFIQFAITEFMKNMSNNYSRRYAWRDVNAVRLNKFAKLNKQKEDGVIIDNLECNLNSTK